VPDLALLLTQLLVILAGARFAGRLVRFAGQPPVIGEMIAGLALGPSVLGAIFPGTMHALFPEGALVPLATLSQLGVILFMFVVGLRLDLGALRGRVTSAIAISHASIVVPFVLGATLGTWLYPELAGRNVARLPFVLFCGAAMGVTAFPVLARILSERNLVGTRLGSIVTACAAVDDVTAWCLLAAVVAVARTGDALGHFSVTLLGAALYTVIVATVGRRTLRAWILRRRETEVGVEILGVAAMLALASALATELLGVHPLFGAFLAGTIAPRDREFATGIADRIEAVVGTVLVPVFFAFTGLRTEVALVTSAGLWGVFFAVLAAAVGGKLGGSAAAARFTGAGWPEALAVGTLMNTRGLMELVILNVGLEIGVIGRELFAMMVLTPLLSRWPELTRPVAR
jgi:K+:H+ antiporter